MFFCFCLFVCFCHSCMPCARDRRPHTYLLSHLWYPVLSLLALGASLWPWHPSFLPTLGSGGGSCADRWIGHQPHIPRPCVCKRRKGGPPTVRTAGLVRWGRGAEARGSTHLWAVTYLLWLTHTACVTWRQSCVGWAREIAC